MPGAGAFEARNAMGRCDKVRGAWPGVEYHLKGVWVSLQERYYEAVEACDSELEGEFVLSIRMHNHTARTHKARCLPPESSILLRSSRAPDRRTCAPGAVQANCGGQAAFRSPWPSSVRMPPAPQGGYFSLIPTTILWVEEMLLDCCDTHLHDHDGDQP